MQIVMRCSVHYLQMMMLKHLTSGGKLVLLFANDCGDNRENLNNLLDSKYILLW